MNEPSDGEGEGEGEVPENNVAETSAPPAAAKPTRHWLRNTVIAVIGTPAFLAVLAVGAFAIYSRSDPRDPNPASDEFQPVAAADFSDGLDPVYYQIVLEYKPRPQGSGMQANALHEFGSILFDEGLTTQLAVSVKSGPDEIWQSPDWDGTAGHRAVLPLAVFDQKSEVDIAFKVDRKTSPRLRWDFDLPDWVSENIGNAVRRVAVDDPAPLRVAPPSSGNLTGGAIVAVRDYKGVAVGDVRATIKWRPSALFDAEMIRPGAAPNPAIAAFIDQNPDTASRQSAVLRMVQSQDSGFKRLEKLKSWIAEKFDTVWDNRAFYAQNVFAPSQDVVDQFANFCTQTYESARSKFGVSDSEAALLTYLLHRDEPSFTTRRSLESVCDNRSLGTALVRIGAMPTAEGPAEKPAPTTPAGKAPRDGSDRIAVSRVEILTQLATEWRDGLSIDKRAASIRFIHPEATLTIPNAFNLYKTVPFADRDAILEDHAGNKVLHFACFTQMSGYSMGAILERRVGQSKKTAIFRYRFYFRKDGGGSAEIVKITRRPAMQQDIEFLLDELRSEDCVRNYLEPERSRILSVIRGESPVETVETTAPQETDGPSEAPTIIGPKARLGRPDNGVTVDLSVLDAIPKSTWPRDGG